MFFAIVGAVASLPIAYVIGMKLDIIDYPNKRKVHRRPTLRTGGVIIFIGFIAGAFLTKNEIQDFFPLVMVASAAFFVGFLEDVNEIRARVRLALFMAIGFVFVLLSNARVMDPGLFVLPSFLLMAFTVFAIAGAITAFNMIDGLNGLSAGLGIISSLCLKVIAYQYNDVEFVTFCNVFEGALIGFVVFNLTGKIFMGDSGSYFIGFVVAAMSIMLIERHPSVSPLAPLLISFLPIFDTLFAVYRRRHGNKDPFVADKRHLHHVLHRRYRSGLKPVVVIFVLQALIAAAAVILRDQGVVLLLLTVVCVMFLRRLWHGSIALGGVRI